MLHSICEVSMLIICDVKFSYNMGFFYTELLVNVDIYITIMRIVLVDQYIAHEKFGI